MSQKKGESKVDELIGTYREYEKELNQCMEKKKQKNEELLELEAELLREGDTTLKKKRDKLQKEIVDLGFRMGVLEKLMNRVKGEIAEEAPREIEGSLQAIERELESLNVKEKEKREEFAKALAKAVGIFEEFHGREITITMDGRLRATYPRVRIGTFAIHGGIQNTYFRELNKIREGQAETLYEKRKKVNKERTRLLKALEREPRELVNEILGVRRPAGGSEDKSPREPRFRAGKLTYSNSEAFKPEYRDSEVPRVDHKSARMYSDK